MSKCSTKQNFIDLHVAWNHHGVSGHCIFKHLTDKTFPVLKDFPFPDTLTRSVPIETISNLEGINNEKNH